MPLVGMACDFMITELLILIISLVLLGLPFMIAFASRLFREQMNPKPFEPKISIIIPAHNEEKNIRSKVLDLLSIDYPKNRSQIIVVDDCSDDRTDDICRRFRGKIIYKKLSKREGKIGALNAGMKQAKNNIIVITDADTKIQPDSIRMLVRNFSSRKIGAVNGNLEIKNHKGLIAMMERDYVNQNNKLLSAESRMGSVVFLYGQLCAFRKDLIKKIDLKSAVDDIEIALSILEMGNDVVHESRAVVFEKPSSTLHDFYRQKKRRTVCSMEVVFRHMGLLNPRFGAKALSFFSHRVMPFFSPFLLAIFMYAAASISFYLIATILLGVLLASIFKPGFIAHFIFMQVVVIASWISFLSGNAPSGASWKHKK